MKILSTETKRIMEKCKERAKDFGLSFDENSIEYIVSNRELTQLGSKNMIPTMYDYWVQDVHVLKDQGVYDLYPSNPYETVINTRPVVSFYNDNNADWLNVMIFYHVIGHIDCFQNNIYFENTWSYNFLQKALSDKTYIEALRREKGDKKRLVDYIIEAARCLDNLVGFHSDLRDDGVFDSRKLEKRIDYFFNVFVYTSSFKEYGSVDEETVNYNFLVKQHENKSVEKIFFENIKKKFPEFESFFKKYNEKTKSGSIDVLDFLLKHSPLLNKPENLWMKNIIGIVRHTSLYFQPQIRTKILNEGWASYWHQKLFMNDERVGGHEVDFARVNAGVMSMPKVGLNPYGLGCRLLEYIEEMANKGKFSPEYHRSNNAMFRKNFNAKTSGGQEALFATRKYCDDFTLLNLLPPNDFQDFIDKNRLYVMGIRMDETGRKKQYYVKSRKGEDYRKLVLDSLYHPPNIEVRERYLKKGILSLHHRFEGKPLVSECIRNVLFHTSKLWGDEVQLKTTEFMQEQPDHSQPARNLFEQKVRKVGVKYIMKDGKFYRREMEDD